LPAFQNFLYKCNSKVYMPANNAGMAPNFLICPIAWSLKEGIASPLPQQDHAVNISICYLNSRLHPFMATRQTTLRSHAISLNSGY
jgi:hypothetical protein